MAKIEGMKIEKRKLKDLNPAEYNPRIDLKPGDAEYEKLRRSIEEFGYVDPIIVNQDGTVIGVVAEAPVAGLKQVTSTWPCTRPS